MTEGKVEGQREADRRRQKVRWRDRVEQTGEDLR